MEGEWGATLLLCGIYSMVAIATQLGILCGAFSLAPIGWMSVGAYAAALAATKWQMGGPAGLAAGIAVAAVFGPLVMLPVRRISGLYFALVSLAFVLVVQSVVSHTDYTGRALGIFGVPLITKLWHVAIALVMVCAVAAYMTAAGRGRALRAAGQDPKVAYAMGINVANLQLMVGAVSAIIAVVAGFLYAHYVGYVDPNQYGFAMVVQIITMVIIGGRGHWLGAIIGAFLITSLPLILRPLAEWRDVVNGVLLIVVAVLMPAGIFGIFRMFRGRTRPQAVRSGSPH